MTGFSAIGFEDWEQWEEIIDSFSQTDSYYTRAYAESFRIHGDGEPKLLYYRAEDMEAMNVVMQRDLHQLKYLNLKPEETYYDLSTPYGYGGFLLKGNITDENVQQLNISYEEFCTSNNIVSEFVRFHPILQNQKFVQPLYDIVEAGDTVVMDLDSEDTIWHNLSSKNRNVIRKAIKNGINVHHGFNKRLFEVFKKMYDDTMRRDKAQPYYFFKDDFYSCLYNNFKDELKIFYAEYEEKVVSIALILFKNKQMHYHLSASDFNFRNLAPTNLLLWEAAKWGCQNRYKTLHLGGGLGGRQDNLYKFKKSFNRNGDIKFFVGHKIFQQSLYDELVQRVKEWGVVDNNYFPQYRGVSF